MLERIKGYIAALMAILAAVKELVDLFEVPKNGEAKKNAVLGAVGILVDLADDVLGVLPKEKVMGVAGAAVDLWVQFKNLTGTWNKTNTDTVLGNS